MVEFLMAAFILAIGLLGLAALQVATQSHGLSGRQRGTATFIAHGVLDQILAEGSITSGERSISTDGNVSLNGRTFAYIKPVAVTNNATPTTGPSYTILGLLPDDPYYTTNPVVDKTIIFTTNWVGINGTLNTYAKNAVQEFIVNVTWNEYNTQTKATDPKAISVSRYVRL